MKCIKKIAIILFALAIVFFVSSFNQPKTVNKFLNFNGLNVEVPDFSRYTFSERFYAFDAVNSNNCEKIAEAKNNFQNDVTMFSWLAVEEVKCLYLKQNDPSFEERKKIEIYNGPFICEEVYKTCHINFKEYA